MSQEPPQVGQLSGDASSHPAGEDTANATRRNQANSVSPADSTHAATLAAIAAQGRSVPSTPAFPVRRQPELIASSAWIAPNATVLGDVTIGDEASVWFGAVARGDTAPITIGPRTNVQDTAVLHADPGFPCVLGADVTVGHGAIVHGCSVGDEVLIGMRATILNGARIGQGSIVGAAALVKEGAEIPPRSLVLGVPARVVRQVTDEDLERMRHGVRHYIAAAAAYSAAESQPPTT
jgi:carbonic anhydrase/acetyltransferase-like protein (isoleucine patch superfamily)